MNEWFDQTSTSLNACSLETFVPIPDSGTYLLPLVIGCYQLEEKTCITAATTTDNPDSTDDTSSLVGQSSIRQGMLQLYMIPSPASSTLLSSSQHAENSKATIGNGNNNETLRFSDSVCIVNMESGVLDGKWRRRRRRCNTQFISTEDGSNCHETMPMYASACASGKIHLHSLEQKQNDSSWTLLHLASSEAEKDSTPNNDISPLCLSLAWNDFINFDAVDSRNEHCHHDQIVSSYSNGTLALHTINTNSNNNNNVVCCSVEGTHKWKAHEMFGCPAEVWTCSFLRGNANVVLSGADDCKLKLWDIRNTQKETYAIGTTEFEAGVTAISSHPGRDYIFAVGSYDEFVRVYDHRKLDQPVMKVGVGGGVWRIKWHPSCWDDNTEQPSPPAKRNHEKKERLLIAAMHGGCCAIDIPGLDNYDCEYDGSLSADDIKVLSEFTAHQSMAYGADWVCFSAHDGAASCSFYDQKAFLWDPNKLKN